MIAVGPYRGGKHSAMADPLDDAEAERQAADARARDLEARIEMVVEILKYLGDDDRKHVLDGALLALSRLRPPTRNGR
jgi:hypothetical protein